MSTQIYDAIIIGAGLSGLAVARFLHHKRPECSLLVLERSDRPGGAVQTRSEEGFLAEYGPHGFLDNCLESRVLIHLAGAEDEVEKAPLGKFVRYICLDGRLRMIPQQPMKIIRADLVPLSAKLRVLADAWKKPLDGEPSVADWVEYRFGRALVPFADAVFTGTYAGDITRLSIDGVMPGVRKLEKEHGSVLKGVFQMLRDKKKKGSGGGKKELPAMTSFSSGMERLILGLVQPLKVNRDIMYRTGVQSIARNEKGWTVQTGHNAFSCRHLVLALPANPALRLLATVPDITAPPLAELPQARVATVILGFTDQAKIPPGFGYLAPEQEKRFALGSLFSSNMFPGRAPAGHVLLETIIGGRRHPERLELDDSELIDKTLADLKELIDLPDPVFARVLRPASGIPQLERGYPALLTWRNQLTRTWPDLHVCGFGWGGIGINDMAKEAWRAAKGVLMGTGEKEEGAEVKGVYF